MVSCKIKGCKNRSDSFGPRKYHFFSFPKDEKLIAKWLEACKTSECTKNSRVCSAHFKESCFKVKRPSTHIRSRVRILWPDAVPTENIGSKEERRESKIAKRMALYHEKLKNAVNRNASTKVVAQDFPKELENFQNVISIKVLDKDKQSISLPITLALRSDCQVDSQLQIENIEAQPHILDHQYFATNSGVENAVQEQLDQNNERILNQGVHLENPKSRTELSDKEMVLYLQKQLQIKTNEEIKLQNQIKRLQKEKVEFSKKQMQEVLKNIFSSRQIDKIMNPGETKIKWAVEDIVSAITLQNMSLKAYCYLRENHYPLPGLSTIRRWTANIKINDGLFLDIINIMRIKAKSLSSSQRIVVLHFISAKIMNRDCIIGIVRGLFNEWMQMIFHIFGKLITFSMVGEIIAKLYEAGYVLVAIICKFDASNLQVRTDLNIGINSNQQCYFTYSYVNEYKVFFLPDQSSVITSFKDYLLNNGFVINGKHVNKQCLEEVVDINEQMEGEISGKMKRRLLIECDSEEDNLCITKILFSKAIIEEMINYGNENYILNDDWEETTNFFKIMSDWIDLYDQKSTEDSHEGDININNLVMNRPDNILNNLETFIQFLRVEGFETLLPFQEQTILHCISVKKLLEYLKKSLNIIGLGKMCTAIKRLSSENCNCIISYLRGTNTSTDSKSIEKFYCSVRRCLLGKCISDTSNNEFFEFSEPCLVDYTTRDNYTIGSNIKI